MENGGQQHISMFFSGTLSACLVGLSGVFPLFFIPLTAVKHADAKELKSLNRWLSYAAGSLLGEVFIHLLPEIWSSHSGDEFQARLPFQCIVAGLLFFFIIEKLFATETEAKQVEGYLNLFANVIDNFTHGIAIGGSYLVSFRLGFITTLCILIHEIPHEMGDFVILLRSGFTRWQAVKGQLTTASGCLFGVLLAFMLDRTRSGWSVDLMLPFTAGGFLYIALVSLVPDLLKEVSIRESLIHIGLVFLGLSTMLLMSTTMN